MVQHHQMHKWFELLRDSWVVRFWVVRGANLLLLLLILLIVVFQMDWLNAVVMVLLPVSGMMILISLVASVSDLIRKFKK